MRGSDLFDEAEVGHPNSFGKLLDEIARQRGRSQFVAPERSLQLPTNAIDELFSTIKVAI